MLGVLSRITPDQTRRARYRGAFAGVPEGETFVYPMDVAWMKDGRLVVADAGAHRLRTWAPGRPVTTLPLQGPLSTPHGVASGPDGTLYVADIRSHRVLAIDGQGRLTTVAGVAGESGADAAHLNRPAAVLVHAGRIWIADLDNHRICAVPLRWVRLSRPGSHALLTLGGWVASRSRAVGTPESLAPVGEDRVRLGSRADREPVPLGTGALNLAPWRL